MFPMSIGTVKARMLFQGVPTVISVGAKSFLNTDITSVSV
jgi:hypothetical protein